MFKINKKTKEALFSSAPFFIIATCMGLAGMLIIDILTPPQPTTFNFTWNGILMFMAICAGIGWMLHGTGFLIVRA